MNVEVFGSERPARRERFGGDAPREQPAFAERRPRRQDNRPENGRTFGGRNTSGANDGRKPQRGPRYGQSPFKRDDSF
jgi:hypothetical protein